MGRAKGNRGILYGSWYVRNISASIQVPLAIDTVCSAEESLMSTYPGWRPRSLRLTWPYPGLTYFSPPGNLLGNDFPLGKFDGCA